MLYRDFGKTGLKLSLLGFGCMRLPEKEVRRKIVVDREEAIRIIRRGIDLGINCVDTAYGYHGGESEIAVGMALEGGYREQVILSTKSPMWDIHTREDYDRILDEQLRKLKTGFLDIYYFHSVDRNFFKEKILKMKLLDRARKALEEGKIRHIAFSFHDTPEVLKEIIDTSLMEGMLVQYSLIDRANERMIEYAKEKGLGVAVMGPVGGGRLAKAPEAIERLFSKNFSSIVEMALRFVFSNPNVTTALSGMGSMKMVEENVNAASSARSLTREEMACAERAAQVYKELCDLYCTGCGYCMPCPNGVNIPLNFNIMNEYRVFKARARAQGQYRAIGKFPTLPGKPASECTVCGECEGKCPQHISIIEQLKEVHKALG